MQLHVLSTEEEVLKELAEFFIQTANRAIEKKGRCDVMLSGGSSPKRLYQLLTSDVFSSATDWNKIFFFLGDERHVPFNDPQYNGRMIQQTLIDPLHIPSRNVFYVDTSLSPELAAADYHQKIDTHFGSGPVVFDLFLLGLGDNAHTASLFPHTDILHDRSTSVKAVYVDELKSWRISVTQKMINDASYVAFLVYGQGKAEAVKHVIEDPLNIEEYPAQLIHPSFGELHWFLDEKAASLLKR